MPAAFSTLIRPEGILRLDDFPGDTVDLFYGPPKGRRWMSYLHIWIWATLAFVVCATLMTLGYFNIEGKLLAPPPFYLETWAGLMAFVTVSAAFIKWLFNYRG
jgi:hypothetical protein